MAGLANQPQVPQTQGESLMKVLTFNEGWCNKPTLIVKGTTVQSGMETLSPTGISG